MRLRTLVALVAGLLLCSGFRFLLAGKMTRPSPVIVHRSAAGAGVLPLLVITVVVLRRKLTATDD